MIQGPQFGFEVQAAKIREFAVALGGLPAIHTDRGAAQAAGYRDLVAPIGLIVWTIVQDRDALFALFGLSAHRGLAGSEGWRFEEPICAGDVLSGCTTHRAVEQRSGRSGPLDLHTLETVYRNQFGRIALVERTTILQWQRPPSLAVGGRG
jgi:acyl dehydratase